jgi:hypothetical protein
VVGGRFDAHRPQQSQGLPVSCRVRFPHPLAPEGTAVSAGHLRGHAAFIQKYQPLGIDPAQRFAPCLTAALVLFAVLFLGVE